MSNARIAADAVARAYANQPTWFRRKGTLLQLLQALGWVLGVLGSMAADWPAWVVVLIGGASYTVAELITALTPDGFSPSMVARAAAAAPVDSPDAYGLLRDSLAVEGGSCAD